MYPEKFLDIPIICPPRREQERIVAYLHRQTHLVRRYIRAKQKLIKLLEEQKQAIIHRAVTRGLDPNVRLKPSGVEWLGDVPEHWEVSQGQDELNIPGVINKDSAKLCWNAASMTSKKSMTTTVRSGVNRQGRRLPV